MLDELDGPQRLNLLKFVCSFAWADLEIRPSERRFVSGLVGRLGRQRQLASQQEIIRREVQRPLKAAKSPRNIALCRGGEIKSLS